MKTTLHWLNHWLTIDQAELPKLAEELTLTGLEVESITAACPEFSEVYVGEVISCEKHPNADKLSLCQVKTGTTEQETYQIICGASNVRAGIKVAVAKVGAVLSVPGITIKKAKLRGVVSNGMICSESELGLAEQSNGIMELPDDAPLGQDFKTYYQLDDQIIDVSITPNRGDCASTLGIARELAVLKKMQLNQENSLYTHSKSKETVTQQTKIEQPSLGIHLSAPSACPKYHARVIRHINPKARSPIWLQEYLRRAGLRSIHPIVDITNFVMLDLGQPLHAYDQEKVTGDITVRMAKAGESITLLDSKQADKQLDNQSLVISDSANNILALAGIMGGENSSVTDTTQHIILESAYFNPETIAYAARHYQILSDSAYRFERGVDPELALFALEKATDLIIAICGGELAEVTSVISDSDCPAPRVIPLDCGYLNKLLGIHLSKQEIITTLEALSMIVSQAEEQQQDDNLLWVKPPSYRHDITIQQDLIEEVLRMVGCDSIPETPPIAETIFPKLDSALDITLARQLMQQQGYHEIISYSFIDPKFAKLFAYDNSREDQDSKTNELALKNPISNDMSVMRASLWPGLLTTALYNIKRQQTRVKLFEQGQCFKLDSANNNIEQVIHIAGLAYGDHQSEQWGIANNRTVDFYDLKAEVITLLSQITDPNTIIFKAQEHLSLHPGQSAQIYLLDASSSVQHPIGWIGVLHPTIVQKFKLASAPVLFELNYEQILEHASPAKHITPISKFPEIRRDLAFIMDKSINYSEIADSIKQLGEENIADVELFDLYQGSGIPDDKKSLAIKLILRDLSKTLVDEDVAIIVKKVISLIEVNFNAILRE